MPAVWRIDGWPRCIAYVFLSHSAEDRDALVVPVYRELERRGIAAWIDRHHYPLGRDPIEALQEELLKARHVAYLITPSLLGQGRGWTAAERAFAAMVQQRLRHDGPEIAHVELPLLFVPYDDQTFLRSVWRSLADKASKCPHAPADEGAPWREEHVTWAADTIEAFIRQEERWALQLAENFDQDSRWSKHFDNDNLRERLLAQSPPPLSKR
jgi:hypothetical protein